MKGIDANRNLTDLAGAIKIAGFSFVCRYLPHSTKDDPLTRAEAQHLSDMGLSIVSLFESGYPTTAAYFTYEQGIADAASALEGALEVGQSMTKPVFFCVDYDADPADIMTYFHAIHVSPLHAIYLPAVYGGSDVCRALVDNGLAHYAMLCQSTGFRAERGVYEDWNLKQGPQQFITFGGERVDVDTQVSRGDDFGQWTLPLTRFDSAGSALPEAVRS